MNPITIPLMRERGKERSGVPDGIYSVHVAVKPRAITTAFLEHILRTALPGPVPSRHASGKVYPISGERSAPLVHLQRPRYLGKGRLYGRRVRVRWKRHFACVRLAKTVARTLEYHVLTD